MASKERKSAPDLTRLELLAREPERFHIFKALRLIEAVYLDAPRLGRARKPAQDPIRLTQEPELAFPPSTVLDFKPAKGENNGHLVNRFFGLWGPNGPMPLHLTEYARSRMRNERDRTLVSFANMFHHRMFALFYRAWAQAEPAPCFDRDDDDPFGEKVAAVAGLLGGGFVDRDEMPDTAKQHFAGRLAQGPRNEEGLLAIVSHFFRAKVSIESFVGCWLTLDMRERFAFPTGRARDQLGLSITVGEQVWSRQAKFRIRIGPLTLGAYHRLLPGGDSLRRLRSIVRNYAGDTMAWDVRLVLRHEDVPRAILGRQGELGWTMWIGQRPDGQDADELVVAPQTQPGPDTETPAERKEGN